MAYKYRFYFIVSAILIAVAVIYCYNPFELYFQNDDFLHIQLSEQGKLFQRNSFRPVCDISIMLDAFIWGKFAAGYHVTNLLLHVIATLLVYRLAVKLSNKYLAVDNSVFALITGLLFFTYPSHSEAVFWILGRSAVLGTIFSLLFLLNYFDANESKKFLFATFWFLIALLTYELAWALPVVVWMLHLISKKGNKTIEKPMILSALFVCYLLTRWLVINEVVGNYEAYNFIHTNVAVLFTNYAKLLFRSSMPGLHNTSFVTSSFIVINVILILCFFRLDGKQKKYTLILALFFIVTLLPYISLGIDTSGTEAERFLYFPSVILCMLVAFVLVNGFKNLKTVLIVSLGFSLVFVQLLFLNALNYRLAGSIVQSFVNEVIKMQHKNLLIIESLPQSQHGALILRQGVESALQVFAPGKFENVVVCSKRAETLFFSNRKYQVREKNINPNSSCYPRFFNVKTETYILFTEDALVVNE